MNSERNINPGLPPNSTEIESHVSETRPRRRLRGISQRLLGNLTPEEESIGKLGIIAAPFFEISSFTTVFLTLARNPHWGKGVVVTSILGLEAGRQIVKRVRRKK